MPIERGITIPGIGVEGSAGYVPPHHPKHAYINEKGMRSLDGEGRVFPSELEGTDIIWVSGGDDGQTVAVIELSAAGLEYLAETLPQYDRFTKDLQYAATLAREIVYDREVSR